MQYYRLLLYIVFGILPSLTWLFYYLKKDLHPEPKKMIIKVFLYGSLVTVPVFFIQIGLTKLLYHLQYVTSFNFHPIVIEMIKWFLVIAFTEELFKYVIVKITAFSSYVIDEPLDIMLYMVVGALGFTAVENILYVFSPVDNLSFNVIIKTTLIISLVRFMGATFLHALCSAFVGYFLAISFLAGRKRLLLVLTGIILATLLHGLYDFSIIVLEPPLNFVAPVVIVMGLAMFVTFTFNKAKSMKSICKI